MSFRRVKVFAVTAPGGKAPMPMSPEEALRFVRKHGVVMEAARGPVPSLAEAVAGERIRGSWWAHARGGEIFAATRTVRDSSDILTCKLINGKITFVHRRLWPALVRLSARIGKVRLAAVREVHTPQGHHRLEETPFPRWVPSECLKASKSMTEAEAVQALGSWFAPAKKRPIKNRAE